VSRWVRERTEGVLTIEDAALYQALHRLEARGWIEAEWGLSENNRKAKYYALTAVGRRQMRSEIAIWKRYAEAVFKVIEPA
jgi:DNA-binding PadR family transcriptional regulator